MPMLEVLVLKFSQGNFLEEDRTNVLEEDRSDLT
jgi:hypothetical protein